MRTFEKHLNTKSEDFEFKRLYDEEKRLINLSLKIQDRGAGLGLSQKELANKANITQQQLSRIENGINCNILTYLKVLRALGLSFDIKAEKKMEIVSCM